MDIKDERRANLLAFELLRKDCIENIKQCCVRWQIKDQIVGIDYFREVLGYAQSQVEYWRGAIDGGTAGGLKAMDAPPGKSGHEREHGAVDVAGSRTGRLPDYDAPLGHGDSAAHHELAQRRPVAHVRVADDLSFEPDPRTAQNDGDPIKRANEVPFRTRVTDNPDDPGLLDMPK